MAGGDHASGRWPAAPSRRRRDPLRIRTKEIAHSFHEHRSPGPTVVDWMKRHVSRPAHLRPTPMFDPIMLTSSIQTITSACQTKTPAFQKLSFVHQTLPYDAEKPMKLGQKLRQLRKGRPYAEVARAADCSPPTIRQIEGGTRQDPSFRTIARLAKYYEVPLDWLADDSQKWPPPLTPQQKAEDIVRAALTKEGLAGELTAEERKLLAGYRTLSGDGRRSVRTYLKAALDIEEAPPAQGQA